MATAIETTATALSVVVLNAVILALAIVVPVIVVVAAITGNEVFAHSTTATAEHHIVVARGRVQTAVVPARSAIAYVNAGTSIVIVVAETIVVIDVDNECTASPRDGVIEVVGRTINGVLPVEEDVSKVHVAERPIVTVDIVTIVDREEIVEVYFIHTLVLVGRKVKFVSHFVREEIGIFTSLSIAHSIYGDCANYEEDEGE